MPSQYGQSGQSGGGRTHSLSWLQKMTSSHVLLRFYNTGSKSLQTRQRPHDPWVRCRVFFSSYIGFDDLRFRHSLTECRLWPIWIAFCLVLIMEYEVFTNRRASKDDSWVRQHESECMPQTSRGASEISSNKNQRPKTHGNPATGTHDSFFLHFILLCRAGRTRPCRTLTGCRPVSQQPVRTVCAAMSFLVPFCSYTYLVQQRNSLRHFAIFPQNLPKKKLCRRHIGLGAPPSATSRVFGCRFSLFLAGRERFPKRNGCSCFGVCGLRA